MRRNTVFNILFTTILYLTGCEGFETGVDFEQKVRGRTINLAQREGDFFQVIREGDTVQFFLSFDKETKKNYIIKSKTDTIFSGTVTKRKELYLLNRQLQNGNYAIHALKFTDSTVTGLETEWMQSVVIKNELDSGRYSDLIRDTIGVETIKAGRKDAKEIFRLVIDKLKAERLLLPEKEVLEQNKTDSIEEQSLSYLKGSNLVNKVYPNPFVKQITVELFEKAPYVFQIYDINGNLKRTKKLYTDNLTILLNDISKGRFVLKVMKEDMSESESFELVKR